MARVQFAKLVFQGTRFDGARMPVDVLPELAAYRSLVLSVAKALFQYANPKRQRAPRGFEANFQLVLDSVEQGNSLIPVLARETPTVALFDDFFDHARDTVEEGINAASNGGVMPAALSNSVLARFAGFGKTLLEGERVILTGPHALAGATYDKTIRSRMLRLSNMSYHDNVDLVGEVIEADREKSAFEFTTHDGVRVPVNSSPLFFSDAIRHFYESDVVRLRGLGLFDANGVLQKIVDTTDISEAEGGDDTTGCPTSVDAQIKIIATLENGWLDETSQKFDTAQLSWLRQLLTAVVEAFALPTPYVYPAPEGHVRAEWSSEGAEIVANVDIENESAEVIVVRGVDSVVEQAIDFAEAGAESKFGQFISKGLG